MATFLPVKAFESMLSDKFEAALLFMKEHLDELARLSMDTLGPLLDEMLEPEMIPLAHHPLLIRLEKLFAERVGAGEDAARPFVHKIKRALQELAKREKKTRKPRKSRR